MKRSGFTIIRNGDSLGYPWQASLRSLAPLVDELVIAHGDSTDMTGESLRKLAAELPCPVRIIDSPWDAASQKGGFELARQTNIALAACSHDVCFYLQSDEVLHEDDYPRLRADLDRFETDADVDALALTWVHFYGNFETVAHSRAWYRREIRVVKRSHGLRSLGDAQSFRIPLASGGWKKARAALSPARCLHYGWARPPKVMAQKTEALDRLWHGAGRDGSHAAENIYKMQYGLRPYSGTHPAVMREHVESFRREFPNFDPFRSQRMRWNVKALRAWSADLIESLCGWRPAEFTNYASLKRY